MLKEDLHIQNKDCGEGFLYWINYEQTFSLVAKYDSI